MKLSIVITAYNYASYLDECIDSCLFQNDANLEYEVIVVDDGSTDLTPDIMMKKNDPRLKKFRIENSGIERASNFGFEKARGNYIVRVDADDRLYPNYICDMFSNLSDEYGFFYSDYVVINTNGTITENVNLPEFQSQEILQRGDFLATGTLYCAKVLKDFGGYSTGFKNSGLENYELILHLINSGFKGKHIPQCLFGYRRHCLSISERKKEQIITYGKELFLKMGLGSYSTNKFHPYKLRFESS
jgi:glycosyltransferase involved in cell wall biosynthesis